MSEPYIGEIRLVSWPFAPIGWALCNGQLLAVAEYETLFGLIGTTYGGNGVQTFALPDLRSRVPMHFNSTYPLGAMLGEENVTLLVSNLPSHNHYAQACPALAATTDPTGAVFSTTANAAYATSLFPVPMSSYAGPNTSSNASHNNMQPYLCVNFIISLYGVYPPQ